MMSSGNHSIQALTVELQLKSEINKTAGSSTFTALIITELQDVEWCLRESIFLPVQSLLSFPSEMSVSVVNVFQESDTKGAANLRLLLLENVLAPQEDPETLR
jgi:hypothetical protein